MTAKLAALVGKHAMGLDVIGNAPCGPSYDCCSCDEVCPPYYTPSPHVRQWPVYLFHCSCDLEREDYPDEKRVLGHYWTCLEPVPRYPERIQDAWAVLDKFEAEGYWPAVYRDENGWHCLLDKPGEQHYIPNGYGPSPQIAICYAALHVGRENDEAWLDEIWEAWREAVDWWIAQRDKEAKE